MSRIVGCLRSLLFQTGRRWEGGTPCTVSAHRIFELSVTEARFSPQTFSPSSVFVSWTLYDVPGVLRMTLDLTRSRRTFAASRPQPAVLAAALSRAPYWTTL